MTIEKIILDEETIEELITAWMETNPEALEEIEDWEDQPPEDELMTLAMDAAVGLMNSLKNPGEGEPAFEVSNPLDQVAEAFFMAFAYETAADEDAFDMWADDHEADVEMEEREIDHFYDNQDE